jgi:hypothetical protein
MSRRLCALCDWRAIQAGHHVTAEILDPDLLVDVCHNHHMLVHDDWLTAGVGAKRMPDNVLERLELRLRRVALFLGRLQATGFGGEFIRLLAVSIGQWADEVAWIIRMLDAFHGPLPPSADRPWPQPGWREAPGMTLRADPA